MRLFVTETMDAKRLGRRRFFFFSTIFAFTSLATWFMADILWRNGLNGIEIPLLILFKDGQPVAQKLGAAPKSQIKGWLESVL